MTQAKINRQKSCLFNYPHRTPFLIFPQYAPFVAISPVHFFVTFRNLHSVPTIQTVPLCISATYKHKKPPASVETLEA